MLPGEGNFRRLATDYNVHVVVKIHEYGPQSTYKGRGEIGVSVLALSAAAYCTPQLFS
jgi:hypothetical protein